MQISMPASPPQARPSRPPLMPVTVRPTRPEDFDAITALCRRVYPGFIPWSAQALGMQRERFPPGQIAAIDEETGELAGFAATLIVRWSDYDMQHTYAEVTGGEGFPNHDPDGRTLYGAEVMVNPDMQGRGVGKAIYAARRDLCRRLNLSRIRAGARLHHYHRYADDMPAREYVDKVVAGEIGDPTLSFQLKQGFKVLDVVADYLPRDAESLGYAAIIEWVNEPLAA